MNTSKKTKAKAMGVKSTFSVDGKAVITTFGKGSDAILEKEVENGIVKNINEKQTIEISVNQPSMKSFTLTNGRTHFPGVQPTLYQLPAQDVKIDVEGKQISYKEELEKRFFGKTFDDNIHIQLVYSILKIEKVLAQYSNTATFMINNLLNELYDESNPSRQGTGTEYDIYEYLNTQNTYREFENPEKYFSKKDENKIKNINKMRNRFNTVFDVRDDYKKEKRRINPRLYYYGKAFFTGGQKLRSNEDIYNCLALLGNVRNFVTDNLPSEKYNAVIYNLDSDNKAIRESFRTTLTNVLSDEVDLLNKDFVENSKTNYHILFNAYNCSNFDKPSELRNSLTCEYYDFAIKKSYKNMGFSVKNLRENIIDEFHPELRKKKYDSCRSKLYKLLDFSIYRYYLHNEECANYNVSKLRATLNEKEKEDFYKNEAKRLYNDIKKYFDAISKNASPESIAKIKKGNEPKKGNKTKNEKTPIKIDKSCIEKVKISGSDFDYFSKLIYVITLYLDGKQINELLTSLIHEFDNINGFKEVLSGIGNEAKFVFPYLFFNKKNNIDRTKKIADELRIINSFARMSFKSPDFKKSQYYFKKSQYIDAMIILGTNMNKKQCSKEADRFLEKGASHGLRNFIANNVLNSNRYKYLIRYIRPATAKAVAGNRNIVEHVLKDMPDTQIERYYKSCYETENAAEPEVMRKSLADAVMKVKYDDFKNVKQDAKKNTRDALDKERKKAVIRIYLTVIYIFVKNMIMVNSRYVIAFHCLERDSKIFGYDMRRDGKTDKNGNSVLNKNYNYLTFAFINTANRLYNAELSKPFKERKKVKRPINQRFCRNLISDSKFKAPGESHKDDYFSNPEKRAKKREMIKNEKIGDNSSLEQSLIKNFRNNVAHLNVVRSLDKKIDCGDGRKAAMISLLGRFGTYFEAYHFLMQLQLASIKQTCGNKYICDFEDVKKLKKTLVNTGVYSKDTVKTLCAPFGYNLVRYKNLSINELFDKNYSADDSKGD